MMRITDEMVERAREKWDALEEELSFHGVVFTIDVRNKIMRAPLKAAFPEPSEEQRERAIKAATSAIPASEAGDLIDANRRRIAQAAIEAYEHALRGEDG